MGGKDGQLRMNNVANVPCEGRLGKREQMSEGVSAITTIRRVLIIQGYGLCPMG